MSPEARMYKAGFCIGIFASWIAVSKFLAISRTKLLGIYRLPSSIDYHSVKLGVRDMESDDNSRAQPD
jgi:hypothetical protein